MLRGISSNLALGLEKVTCGSIIKLTNVDSGYKLHSHSVAYGRPSFDEVYVGFNSF